MTFQNCNTLHPSKGAVFFNTGEGVERVFDILPFFRSPPLKFLFFHRPPHFPNIFKAAPKNQKKCKVPPPLKFRKFLYKNSKKN